MSKPSKTEAELIAIARAELKVHADCPDGIVIFVLRSGDSWEFRTEADEATVAKPGYPECVAMLVQIGDHLSKQYDVKGEAHFASSIASAPNTSYQAAARLVGREAGAFFGGGRSRSAGTWKRARSLCTIAMLSPFLPRRTSLSRLGVPRIGTMSARVRPC